VSVQHITRLIALSINNILEIEKTCTKRERYNLQNINHRTHIMKEKYFCILAYKHETGYKGLSHRHKMWPDDRAIHKRTDQPSLADKEPTT
jgi:hypothetical protein